jgi:hypothetical protein
MRYFNFQRFKFPCTASNSSLKFQIEFLPAVVWVSRFAMWAQFLFVLTSFLCLASALTIHPRSNGQEVVPAQSHLHRSSLGIEQSEDKTKGDISGSTDCNCRHAIAAFLPSAGIQPCLQISCIVLSRYNSPCSLEFV